MGKTFQSVGRQKAKHHVACPRWNANAIEYVATTGADLLRGRGNWALKESWCVYRSVLSPYLNRNATELLIP